MSDPVEETNKRLRLVDKEMQKFRNNSLGVILAGSVAYSPNLNVTDKSDLDLLVIVEDVKSTLPLIFYNEKEITALQRRFFEGYCVKSMSEDVPVSLHVLSEDAFDIISKCFVADIRVYRPGGKPGNYQLNGFEGNTYDYYIRNITLDDLDGVRTIVPISFIHKDRFYIGIHRDKLLSHPKILHGESFVSAKLDKLWTVIVENLYDEARRLYSNLDLDKMNVLNALAKSNKMCPEVIASIKEKTEFYLSKLK